MVYAIKYRRRREGRTNYHKRLKLLQSGSTRVIVRRSNTGMTVQFADYQPTGDLIRAGATAKDVRSVGLTTSSAKSLPGAYLTGYIAGLRAKNAGVTSVIVDLGMQTSTKGNRLYATIKGVVDAGVSVSVDESMFPTQERLEGKHITTHRTVTIQLEELKAKAKTLAASSA
jgi:large subunit ribosomal protein L18